MEARLWRVRGEYHQNTFYETCQELIFKNAYWNRKSLQDMHKKEARKDSEGAPPTQTNHKEKRGKWPEPTYLDKVCQSLHIPALGKVLTPPKADTDLGSLPLVATAEQGDCPGSQWVCCFNPYTPVLLRSLVGGGLGSLWFHKFNSSSQGFRRWLSSLLL